MFKAPLLAFTGGLFLLTAQTGAVRFDDAVRGDIFAGFAGDKAALERGMKKCQEILERDPKHAEAMVWYGSTQVFLAGEAFQRGDQARGLELGGKGRALMDEAVALEPKSIGVRIPRGATLIGGARFRTMDSRLEDDLRTGISDYLAVYDIQKAFVDRMPVHAKGELLLRLANAYARIGEKENAKEWFESVARKTTRVVHLCEESAEVALHRCAQPDGRRLPGLPHARALSTT